MDHQNQDTAVSSAPASPTATTRREGGKGKRLARAALWFAPRFLAPVTVALAGISFGAQSSPLTVAAIIVTLVVCELVIFADPVVRTLQRAFRWTVARLDNVSFQAEMSILAESEVWKQQQAALDQPKPQPAAPEPAVTPSALRSWESIVSSVRRDLRGRDQPEFIDRAVVRDISFRGNPLVEDNGPRSMTAAELVKALPEINSKLIH